MKYFLNIVLSWTFIFFGGLLYSNLGSQLFAEEFSSSDVDELYQDLGEDSKGSGLPTNPIELMNMLKRSSAMDDATDPSDAIDQALKNFYNTSEKLSDEN
tara:strand:+ start:4431 stop:4730 length:300 start_codon:yes stop_codon:yes gene_type:complete